MTTYYDLYIRCPACIAKGEPNLKPPSQWFHANQCGGRIKIGDDANLKCISCGYINHVKNWRYACSAHETDYRPCTSAGFANAISIAGEITSIAGIQWMRKLLDNLGDDW